MTPDKRIESANGYRDEERFVEAWAEMQAVSTLARGTREYLILVTFVAPALGKWHEAAEANRQLARMEPGNILHWMSLGAAVGLSLGPLAAAEVYAEAAQRNPDVISYPYNHAACLCAAGRIGEARCVLYVVLKRSPQMLQNALDDGRFEALADMLILMEDEE